MSERKDQIRKFQNFTNASMSGTTTITSLTSSVQFVDNIGLEWIWSGAPVGNFQVQTSIDYDPNETIAGNWVPLLFTYWNGSVFVTSYMIPTSLGSPYYLDIDVTSIPWIRVVYTNISGSGTLNGFLTAKAI
jgi:hypothetical protein